MKKGREREREWVGRTTTWCSYQTLLLCSPPFLWQRAAIKMLNVMKKSFEVNRKHSLEPHTANMDMRAYLIIPQRYDICFICVCVCSPLNYETLSYVRLVDTTNMKTVCLQRLCVIFETSNAHRHTHTQTDDRHKSVTVTQ